MDVNDLGVVAGESDTTIYPIVEQLKLQDLVPMWKRETPKAFGVVMACTLLEALPSDLKFEAQRFWRPVIAAETGEYGPALILQSGEFWLTPKTLIACQLAFHTKQLTNELRLDIVLRAEIDSARLGLWSIFYHSRGYLVHRAITVNLTSLERQKFA